MSARRTIEATPARRVAPAAGVDAAGEQTGLVELKTRVPIHLHLALVALAERNDRSMAAELRRALAEHVEREMRR